MTKYRSVKISAVSVLSTGNMARTEFLAFQVVYLLRVTDYAGAAYSREYKLSFVELLTIYTLQAGKAQFIDSRKD